MELTAAVICRVIFREGPLLKPKSRLAADQPLCFAHIYDAVISHLFARQSGQFRGPEQVLLRCSTRDDFTLPGSQLAPGRAGGGRRGRKRTKKTRSWGESAGGAKVGLDGAVGGFLGAAARSSSWRRATSSKRALRLRFGMRDIGNEWRRGLRCLARRKLDGSVAVGAHGKFRGGFERASSEFSRVRI